MGGTSFVLAWHEIRRSQRHLVSSPRVHYPRQKTWRIITKTRVPMFVCSHVFCGFSTLIYLMLAATRENRCMWLRLYIFPKRHHHPKATLNRTFRQRQSQSHHIYCWYHYHTLSSLAILVRVPFLLLPVLSRLSSLFLFSKKSDPVHSCNGILWEGETFIS